MKNIEFTQEQFEALLKLVYIGEWFINAQRLPNEEIQKFQNIEQYLYSHASHFDLANLITIDPDTDEVYPSKELEFDEEIQRYMNEYNEDNFWSELCSRLAERDAIKIHGLDKLSSMDAMERFEIISDLEAHYIDRFSLEGLEKL